jgi:hypothetical protein
MEHMQQLNTAPKMRSSLERHDLNSLENFEGINLFNLMLNVLITVYLIMIITQGEYACFKFIVFY